MVVNNTLDENDKFATTFSLRSNEKYGLTEINPRAYTGYGATEINSYNGHASEHNEASYDARILNPGDIVFGKFTIDSFVKQGGESQVYKAFYGNTPYAVKVYKKKKRFNTRLYDIIQSLKQPNIVRLFEYGENDSHSVEVLEWFDGGNLEGYRCSSINELRRIVTMIIAGLKVLFSNKVYHGDIKPSNLLFTTDGRVAIGDFSLCTIESENKYETGSESHSLGTMVQDNRGARTPLFAAPEAGNIASVESDLYSLGVTIMCLYYGSAPYKDASRLEMLVYRACTITPPDCPSEVACAIDGLVRYNPDSRLTLTQLEAWCRGEKISVCTSVSQPANAEFTKYELGKYKVYNSYELRIALTEEWEEGIKRLFRGDLYDFFIHQQANIASCIKETISTASKDAAQRELVYFDFLYKLCPKDKSFVWHKCFKDSEDLSEYILSSVRTNTNRKDIDNMLCLRVLSHYFRDILGLSQQGSVFSSLEQAYSNALDGKTVGPVTTTAIEYAVGFLLTKKKRFRISNKYFSVKDVAKSPDKFASSLTLPSGAPTEELAGLLISEGRLNI